MAKIRIDIVTFNGNEAAAVNQLFRDMYTIFRPWCSTGNSVITLQHRRLRNSYEINHRPLNAQGNVVAAGCLAGFYERKNPDPPEYVLFYGCAGALNKNDVSKAFLVEQASYASLGTVANNVHCQRQNINCLLGEKVTLKNKWLCDTDASPKEVDPLELIKFNQVLGKGFLFSLAHAKFLHSAHVVATDKVIKVGPATRPPRPKGRSASPNPIYVKGEWSYSEILAFAKNTYGHLPIIVEMESYGIGRIAKAAKLLDRIVIIRIVTDYLEDHSSSDKVQRSLLKERCLIIGLLLLEIICRAEGLIP
jgi:hypothetical protein